MRLKTIIFLIFILLLPHASGQKYDPDSPFYSNLTFDQKIKTVQLYKDGWELVKSGYKA